MCCVRPYEFGGRWEGKKCDSVCGQENCACTTVFVRVVLRTHGRVFRGGSMIKKASGFNKCLFAAVRLREREGERERERGRKRERDRERGGEGERERGREEKDGPKGVKC